MRQLTLKELAPYLPYGLRVWNRNIQALGGTWEMNARGGSGYVAIDDLLGHYGLYKPILRPLSDLGKPDWSDEAMDKHLCNNDAYLIKVDHSDTSGISYSFMTWLLSQHFDVFNLIKDGLAIDINTIK